MSAETIAQAEALAVAHTVRSAANLFLAHLDGELARPDDEVVARAAAALSTVYGLPPPDHARLVRWPERLLSSAICG